MRNGILGLVGKKVNHYLSALNLALLRQEARSGEGTGAPDWLCTHGTERMSKMASSLVSFTCVFCVLIFQVSDMRYKAVRTENTHLKGMMGDLDPARYLVMH